jgi:paraquat-inducible protein A
MGIAFWALMVFVVIDLYITKMIHISELWILRRRIFMDACR